jgi:hypothetical protein
MGVNAYTTNTGVRERQSTYVPLPFEEMFKTLQFKQQKWDEAEAFEINERNKISALSSPILGYQEYLDEYKTKYLNEALTLHKSIPDKGSAEFRRKIQDLVGAYSADRTRQLIVRDSEMYGKFLADKASLLKDNKYSMWRNSQYEGFTGKDANGIIIPFVYNGVQAKKDVSSLINVGIDNTQTEDVVNSSVNPITGLQIKTTKKGKDPKKAFSNVLAQLGQDGVMDFAEENGLSPKDALKVLEARISGSVGYTYGTEQSFDFSYSKERREREKHADEFSTPEVTRLSNVQSPYFDEDLNKKIEDDGSIIPSGIWGFQDKSTTYGDDARIAKIMKNSNMFYGKKDASGKLSGGGKVGLAALKKGTNTIKDLDLIHFSDNEKGLTHRKNKLADITSSFQDVVLYDETGKAVGVDDKKELFSKLTDKDKFSSVAGRFKSHNPFAPEAYQLLIDGKKYIAGFESSNVTDNVLHAISKSNITKEPVDLEKYGVTVYTRPDVNINDGGLKNNVIIVDKKTNKQLSLSELGIK